MNRTINQLPELNDISDTVMVIASENALSKKLNLKIAVKQLILEINVLAVIPCKWCGQWGAVGCACKHCGGAIK